MAATRRTVAPAGGGELPWPLSPGVLVGETLWIAGQVALDENLELVGPGDALAQARHIWENIDAVARAAGGSAADVVRIVTYVTDYAHGEAIHAARSERFPAGNFPAATMVEVPRLGIPGALLETDATAIVGCGTGC